MGVLSRITEELENAQGPLTLAEMGRRLDIERSALAGMLEFLVRKGKLREVDSELPECSRCWAKGRCAALLLSRTTGRLYELVGADRGR